MSMVDCLVIASLHGVQTQLALAEIAKLGK
jgi:hypothetical protein